ncbi:hypothetical protein [Simkania sp.]|uniref:hypothetical protein n=1 Tax=Simkania sp. TaxID=34094 RepID=UPI003B51CFB3
MPDPGWSDVYQYAKKFKEKLEAIPKVKALWENSPPAQHPLFMQKVMSLATQELDSITRWTPEQVAKKIEDIISSSNGSISDAIVRIQSEIDNVKNA